ncbi:hypothetical protein BDV96DRAFT_214601 [Lophiotrema nucula]|uniref:Uncharacterized protein n=1 Tax=Lophiotrema nucula TaxID=690887 RepID=A0A6A5ZR94_9PLEO|nr:hypothetical protein BDV96DRAFT_214601 [Lophiotrema nucula]
MRLVVLKKERPSFNQGGASYIKEQSSVSLPRIAPHDVNQRRASATRSSCHTYPRPRSTIPPVARAGITAQAP